MLFFGWILKFVKKYRTRGGFNDRCDLTNNSGEDYENVQTRFNVGKG
jgi:hypothetical protein